MAAAPIYAVNFKAQELRAHRTPNRVRFGAPDDATAATIASIYAAQVTSAVSSTVKRIQQDLQAGGYPQSTGFNAVVRMRDATGGSYTARLRNVLDAAASRAVMNALFTGTAGTGVAALSGHIYLPNSGSICTLASPAITTLH